MSRKQLKEWLVCPECGSENVEEPYLPKPGYNAYFTCNECGETGVMVG